MSKIKQEHDQQPLTQAGQAEDTRHMATIPDKTEASLPVVDSGLLCWLQVIGSFAMWSNSWGVVNSFGVFQTFYEVSRLSNTTPTQISWIGGLQSFLLVFVGVLSGPVYDAGYLRFLNLAGNFLVVFGLMMTSLCTEYWQVILAQGLVTGFGCGMLFVPATAVVPQYFVRRRNLAATLAAAGSGFGGLIYPIIFRQLEQKINFAWAVRTMAFVSLLLGIISNATVRNRVPAKAMRALFDPAFFHNTPILLFASACCVAFAGLYVPPYYIGIYSLSIGGSEDAAFYLVAAMQAGSILGRVGPGYFADRTGPLNMLIPACLAAGMLTLCWMGIENVPGLFVFAVLYGAAFGLALAMAAMCILSLLKGQMAKFGTTLGMCLFFSSPGVLVGGPIAGAILNDGDNFVGVQAFSGCMIILAGLLALAARVLTVGFKAHKI